ncbi:hypothetical protein QUB33_06000 [Microcoleus sp. B3-A4]|uniref:hypothetical protein n=1 Tax=Microcoleus sp. B3-A4 TaxID=2818653 RepID=UPI002FD5D7B7
MSLPYLTKIDNSDLEAAFYGLIHPLDIPDDRPALRLANRLRWDRLNIEPELQALFRYYRNTCSIVNKTQGFDAAKSHETYDEIGQLLANMWSIEQLTALQKLNYYRRGASL